MSERNEESLLESKLSQKADEVRQEALDFMKEAVRYVREDCTFDRELTTDEAFEIASRAWDINCWEPGFQGVYAIDEAVEDFRKQAEREAQDYDAD